MDQRPEQPPEGKLIEDAAKTLDISIREAAKRAGISYGRWRQIVKGYQNVGPGVYAPVRNAPAKTVARMASVVGVTPAQLSGAGREDAARVLEAMQQRDAAVRPAPRPAVPDRQPVDFSAGVSAEQLRPYLEAVTQEAFDALQGIYPEPLPGPDDPDVQTAMSAVPGALMFPGASWEASIWGDDRMTVQERLTLIARTRWLAEQMAREHRRTGTGLIGNDPGSGAIPALFSVAGRAFRASS